MALHSWELQKAVFTKISAASITGIGSVAVGVYDHVPTGTAYPYISLGEETAINIGTKDKDGNEHTLTLHVWSQYQGRREIKEIMQSIYTQLHDTDISVTGASFVNIKQEFETTLMEVDGITRHGIIRFRAVVFDS
jgi:hypothetical protein